MKPANLRLARKLTRRSLPPPVPDMSEWTMMERLMREAEQRGLEAMVRASYERDGPPTLKEEWDAQEARDASIVANRAAKAAAEALALDPTSLRAERRARETREAAERAVKAAEEARRVAEEAKSRPRPPEPAIEPQPVAETPAPVPATPEPEAGAKPEDEAEPKPQREKQWWEERAKWQLRRPVDEDERRGRPLHECIHEYDPLDAEEDYDPFE